MNIFDNITLVVKLGFRNMFRQKRRSLLIISASMAGVLGVLFTMALTNGFLAGMIDNGIEAGIGHIQIRPTGWEESRNMGMVLENPSRMENLLKERLTAKVQYSTRLEKEGLLRVGNFTEGVLLIGVNPEKEIGVSRFAQWISKGNFLKKNDVEYKKGSSIPCIIGKANSVKMEVEPGDWAVLSLSDSRGNYKSVRCIVEGVFFSGIEPIEKHTVILNRKDLSSLYSGKPDMTGYFVFLTENEKSVPIIKSELKKILNSDSVEILTYEEIEKLFSQIINMSDTFSWILYLILLLGVALILFDSIMMSIYERIREIGIMRALGSQPGLIFFMIIFEGIILTLAGAVLGIFLGELCIAYFQIFGLDLSSFAKGMETFDKLGSTIYPFLRLKDFIEAIYIPLIISFFSGIIPAWKAVRLSPIKAIYNR